uniref:Uncharacterized protein n=1 Tax=Arundo donax TaxID=35708 RepID=A0A0A9EG85_ARUDO
MISSTVSAEKHLLMVGSLSKKD